MKQLFTLLSLIFLGTQFSFSQTYFSEDFEGGQGSWTFFKNNSGTHNWATVNASSLTSEFGSTSIWSRSYVDGVGPVTPDNLAISPVIDLTGASGDVVLEYQFYTQPSYPADKYSVYVTTSNTPATILASTPVHTEVATSNAFAVNRQIDLSDYAGQTIYITFRHYDCYDKYWIVIDNVKVRDHLSNDVAIQGIEAQKYILTNQDTFLGLNLLNVGNNDITSVTVNWNDGTDYIATIPVSIAPGASATVNHPVALNYTTATSHSIEVTVTEVNGGTDPDMSNNSLNTSLNTLSQSATTKVLVEEGTGTWCQFCPRGMLAMEYMYNNHSDKFVGIAVHDGIPQYPDPMEVPEYANASSFTGLPGMHIDRTIKDEGVTQQLMEGYVLSRYTRINPVAIGIATSVSGNELTVDASATFYSNFSNVNFRLAAIVIENGVTGTTPGYAQVNAYSGGSYGPMGGYENLPNPVPASMMVYDHVGRALLGGYNGQEGSVPTTLTDGQEVNYTFNYTVPASYDIDRIHVVVLVLDADTGQVVNANSAYVGTLGVNNPVVNSGFSVYPNPANDIVNLQFNQDGKFTVKVYDITGKEVLAKAPEFLTSNTALPLNVSTLSQGMYIISIEGENQSFSQKLIIK